MVHVKIKGRQKGVMFRSIDLKIDDGKASSGMFHAYRTWQSFYGNCLTGADGDYLITNNRVACQALYLFEE